MDVGATQTAPAGAPAAHKGARTALIAFLLLATVMWIGIAVGANMRTPGIVGLATSVVGGLFSAVLTAAIGGWIALKLAAPVTLPPAGPAAALPDHHIAPALAELDRLQRPIARRMVERAAWRMPVCAAAGVAIWSALLLVGAPGGMFDFMAVLLGGGLVGYAWSRIEAAREHAEAYTTGAVDTLVRDMGGLSWRNSGDGEIAGHHAGVSVRIAPLTPPKGATGVTGLQIELQAPSVSASSLDQLALARPSAPALIEQLSTLPGLGRPTSSISGGKLVITIPETLKPRVFDPPPTPGTAPAAPRLARLRQVASAVMHVADALSAQAPLAAASAQA